MTDDRCPACGHHMNWVDGYGYICNKRGGCGSEWEISEYGVEISEEEFNNRCGEKP